MVRRRRAAHGLAGGIPVELASFESERWPGDSDFARWQAWDEALRLWADTNLPAGVEDLPGWVDRLALMPDAPFDPSSI